MYCFSRLFIWLYRWRHSRGFGVQSPNDYSFIRYVINEHYPYYAYSDLRISLPRVSDLKRKKAELYFRIANWLQPERVFIFDDDSDYAEYIKAGCKKAILVSDFGDIKSVSNDIIIMKLSESTFNCISDILNNVGDDSICIVENIYSGHNKRLWDKLKVNPSVGITYDLYYVGLIFFDKTRYKQHYKVNF